MVGTGTAIFKLNKKVILIVNIQKIKSIARIKLKMQKLYSSHKFMYYGDQLAALREKRVVAPVHIRIKPMNHCNHDCWYCAYRVSNLELGEDIDYRDKIPEDKIFEIVDDVISMGVKAVTFSGGGEPLLYKPLPDVIERLAGHGIKVATLTNGSNLKGKVADAFAKYGTWVRVSIDGWDNESYAKSRKIEKDSFSKLIKNMREFASRDSKCVLGVSYIVDQNNCSHIYEVCELLKDVGVNHVKLSGVVVSNHGAENNIYHSKISDVVSNEINKALKLNSDKFTVINHYHELDARFDKEYTTCPQLMYLTVIGADCKVYTCQDKAFTEPGTLGSIKDISFKDFWFSETNQKNLYDLNPSIQCKHHCISNSKNLAIRDILEIDPDHSPFV